MNGSTLNRNLVVAAVVVLSLGGCAALVVVDALNPDIRAEDTVGHVLTILTPTLVALVALLNATRAQGRADAAHAKATNNEALVDEVRELRQEVARLRTGLGQGREVEGPAPAPGMLT